MMQEHQRYFSDIQFENTKNDMNMQTKNGLESKTNDKCERITDRYFQEW